MSLDWGVIPAQPEEPAFCQWLLDAGLEPPALPGRYPTLEQLLAVLRSFEGWPLQTDLPHSMVLGVLDSPQYASILGGVHADGLFHFHFHGNRCQDSTMIKILRKLAVICGPIVLYETLHATPVVIDQFTDVGLATQDWQRRTQQRMVEWQRSHQQHKPNIPT